MNAINWKKLLLPNIPYLLFVYLFDKVGQAVRLAPGADLSGKVLSLGEGFSMAFANPLPSLAPMDLLIGIFGALLIRLIVYVKGKNAKKYRKGVEYGSARWLGLSADVLFYPDMPLLEQQTKQLLCKFAACTEDERAFLMKTLDCMAEQMLSRHERETEDNTTE